MLTVLAWRLAFSLIMVGKTKDPKDTRITVRISEQDLRDLQEEARRRNISVGGVVRVLIRDGIRVLALREQRQFG